MSDLPLFAPSDRECHRCHKCLPLTAYHRDKNLLDGRRYICKRCANHAARLSRNKKNNTTQGLYSIFHGMKKRCYSPGHHSYCRYGGRGIHLCDAWLADFEVFQQWAITNGYRRGLQIDRIDNDGPYAPENCRWVTRAENIRNRRNTRLSADDVSQIRMMLHRGQSQQDVASHFKISSASVSMIHTRKWWKDVA